MKKSTMRWVIGMMSIALIGLIGFQLYWIDSVVRANDEQFKKDVLQALTLVSKKLEAQEALVAFHNQRNSWSGGGASFTFTSTMPGTISIVDDPSSNGYGFRTKIIQQEQDSDEPVVIRDTVDLNGINFVFDIQANPGTQQVLTLPGAGGPQPPSSYGSIQDQLKKVTEKSEMVFQVLEHMLVPEQSLMARFNPEQLDSLLSNELFSRGIDIDFDYGIISPEAKKFVLLTDDQAKEKLFESDLKASLFPNDLIGSPNWLVVDFPGKESFLLRKIWLTMTSSGLLVLIIMISFGYSIHTIIRQKKLSEMKNDFINNMTHELKTPIATISLASEALTDKDVQQVDSMRDRYVKVIGEENQRLGEQVERVLQMAALDKRDFNLKSEEILIEDLVRQAIDKTELRAADKGVDIKYTLDAGDTSVMGDRTHLTNIVLNLLDNAIKYSGEAPRIMIRTWRTSKKVMLSVQDHGIGISKEGLKHIFEKFYRVPTGNIHNVKGFGLGLAYVKSMVLAHNGDVSVESELDRGTRFIITLPIH